MIGAIVGDIIGSVHEFKQNKPDYNFKLFTKESKFTDDTVLTIALADSILSGILSLSKLRPLRTASEFWIEFQIYFFSAI